MRLSQIESRLRRIEQRLGADRLAGLPEQIAEYYRSGALPDDEVACAFIRLNEAAIDCMNSSVDGAGGDEAARRYEAALSQWQRVSQGAGP